ncbi:A-kinase anchor protein SPHKAP isoform X2 [Amia ocellicauda]|uniref:A-kinase anchor protein SPHKAP isoform X2 n=1 Tax=Amia ocellicauda TaxID=2972642 RepID=UPI0034638D40
MIRTKCFLSLPSNFEASPMIEISENLEDPLDTAGVGTDSTLGSSVTACKKVLCSNSLLDSTEYWLRNEKTLCKIGFLEDKCDSNCTTICFVNLDKDNEDYRDDKCIKKLAAVSPALPKLIESLNVQQPRENEIFLLSGLDSSEPCQQDLYNQQSLRAADVCLIQCARGNKHTHPSCIIFEINKFLIGLESGQERQLQTGRYGYQKAEDDTNRSVSSIEEDFLTASEHLEDSEEDAYRNDFENNDFMDLFTHDKNIGGMRIDRLRHKKGPSGEWDTAVEGTVCVTADKPMKPPHSRSPLQNAAEFQTDSKKSHHSTSQGFALSKKATQDGHSAVPKQSSKAQSRSQSTQESAGHYATNLAESVLQDAFIKLSQDEPYFTTEAALSVSAGSHIALSSKTNEPKPTRGCSFELPKIVIVQSPDNCESVTEWPGTPSSHTNTWEENDSLKDTCDHPLEHGSEPSHFLPKHTPKPVEVALACAASVIGTISSPQATEKLKLDPSATDLKTIIPAEQTSEDYEEDDEDEEEEEEEAEKDHLGMDYSFSSALCGMAQVASAVAVVDLTEEPNESYSPSQGLLSAAEASAAITLHCSVTVGSRIDPFTTNIAEVLLNEASSILTQPENYGSIGDFLESTQNKIVESITKPTSCHLDEIEVDAFANMLSDAIFKHSLERAMKRKELESPSKYISDIQDFVLESANNLLLDVLLITSKKISDISRHSKVSSDMAEVDIGSKDYETTLKKSRQPLNQLLSLIGSSQSDNIENQTNLLHSKDKLSNFTGIKEEKVVQEEQETEPASSCCLAQIKDQRGASLVHVVPLVQDCTTLQYQISKSTTKDLKITPETDRTMSVSDSKQPFQEILTQNIITEKHRSTVLMDNDTKLSTTSSWQPLLSPLPKPVPESKSSVSGFADDLAATVVSMATEMAAICLENSNGKQPWFCAWKGGLENPENYLMPCRTVKRKKESQSNAAVTKKHRPPRLSEIKKKTEEQPELMERLMNRVVDESMNLDEPTDPFTLFATEVTAKIMNCPELNVVDTSKQGHPRTRLQCDRWSRGKASSYESIPEEDADSSHLINMLGPGTRLGQNMSRGSSISKQSSCESITDEFSRFMVNQMENEGRGFDLLLDYYAGKNANNILSSAMQQVTKKNGHLNVRSTCLSKQSSTESITEEFYRFMLKEMDKENKDYNALKTKEWSNSLLPPTPRTPFCFRQSSMPDRRSSDSRLTVNSPVKANSFDGFARNIHGDTLSIYSGNTVSATGLCKSDSCLYQRGHTDQITDMLIHETWSSSIESLMRKNKIIVDDDDSMDLDLSMNDSQPHVELFANRLAADIVESGRSLLGGQQESVDSRPLTPVAERRRCFKSKTESRFRQPASDRIKSTQERKPSVANEAVCIASLPQCPREVPLIQIEGDQREEFSQDTESRDSLVASPGTPGRECHPREKPKEMSTETTSFNHSRNGNSSASSLGLADLESFPDIIPPCKLISEIPEGNALLKDNQENVDEMTSGLSIGASSSHRELLVMNFDLEPDCVDSELRVTLQWIAASELGVPTIYFRKSQEKRIDKFLEIVRFVHQKAWNVGDLFHAVVQYCKLQDENGDSLTSLYDWLLETC